MAFKPSRMCLLIQGIPTPDKWCAYNLAAVPAARLWAVRASLRVRILALRLHPRRLASLGIPLFQPQHDEATLRAAEEPTYKEAYLAHVGGKGPGANGDGSHHSRKQGAPHHNAPLPGWVEVVRAPGCLISSATRSLQWISSLSLLFALPFPDPAPSPFPCLKPLAFTLCCALPPQVRPLEPQTTLNLSRANGGSGHINDEQLLARVALSVGTLTVLDITGCKLVTPVTVFTIAKANPHLAVIRASDGMGCVWCRVWPLEFFARGAVHWAACAAVRSRYLLCAPLDVLCTPSAQVDVVARPSGCPHASRARVPHHGPYLHQNRRLRACAVV